MRNQTDINLASDGGSSVAEFFHSHCALLNLCTALQHARREKFSPFSADLSEVIWLLFLAVSVKDTSALRTGCAADESPVTTLAAGTTVTIRFAMAGDSTPCYKVSAEVAGKTI